MTLPLSRLTPIRQNLRASLHIEVEQIKLLEIVCVNAKARNTLILK